MIPVGDTIPTRHPPVANWLLIAACTAAFWVEWQAGPGVEALVETYGLVPAAFVRVGERVGYWRPGIWTPLVTSVFLHAGLFHFLGNMWFLWIFGDNVEDRFGHAGYLGLFLAGGAFAGLAHVVSDPRSIVPTVGASGAIATVMGAYLVLHPAARINSIVLPFPRQVAVPAIVWLGLWFVTQLLHGTAGLSRSAAQAGGVAWWAHAGGFAFGVLFVLILGRHPSSRG